MLIRKSEAVKKANGNTCKVREYEFDSSDFGVAKAKITGRYPESGTAMNTGCDQVYVVISGTGMIHSITSGSFEVSEGDSYWFVKNEGYYVVGDAMEVILMNAPAWNLDQYVLMDD